MGRISKKKQDKFCTRYGPWAVVTGASSGIGREIAIDLAQRGLNLVLVARSRDMLKRLAADLSAQHGIETQVISVDLSELKATEVIEANTSHLDVGLLVAAAGFGTSGLFLDSILDEEIKMLNLNCQTLMLMCLHFGKRLAIKKRGGIILMSSIVAFQGVPNSAHYSATKAYVQSLAEALNVELAAHGIDVLSSAPGPVNTNFAKRAGMQMGSVLKPKKVAQATVNALGKKGTVLPGLLSKLIPYSLATLPPWARVRIIGMVMKGMVKN